MASCPFSALAERHMASCITLSTIQRQKPCARTVLFQGFATDPETTRLALCIKTSKHSRKVQERDSDAVEIVSWNESTMVQMRFAGDIKYVDDTTDAGWLALTRQRVWSSLGRGGAQSQFFYAGGLARSSRGAEFAAQEAAYQAANGAIPESFVVGVLCPSSVDFLDLSTCERMAWKLENQGSWAAVSGVAPPVVSIPPEGNLESTFRNNSSSRQTKEP
ncbi:hypothetical protein FVE85_2292 [Porphyridium purpureum]|uniref:Pyridoxamine 5'-phosphate oxidase Alr4036 family FMN-binding domain-containing protein n=1 Tax=Porphyridium purpureum TaxID=35688 RepID=A0A5J4Z0A5_PORPP|nr:hypothetical protein FVE85_2292 [Porphyridium purpureum]|eukprot:POR4598..scf209_3